MHKTFNQLTCTNTELSILIKNTFQSTCMFKYILVNPFSLHETKFIYIFAQTEYMHIQFTCIHEQRFKVHNFAI